MDDDDLYALLSAIAPTYPVVVPIENKDYPAIVYRTVGTDYLPNYCGSSQFRRRVQIDVYAITFAQCKEIGRQITDAVKAEKINERDTYDTDIGSNETIDLYRKIMEFYL